jgi:hypothetical protein
MVEKLSYSGPICYSGVVISFSGLDLSLDELYSIKFDNLSTIPSATNVTLNPTGFLLAPSEKSPVLSTIFKSASNYSNNASLNLISLSVYNESNELIHRDYKSISCESLCGTGIPLSPTPTVTPTITPTITPTPTQTPPPPSPQPTLNIRTAFDRLINVLPTCNKVLIRAKAYGDINQTYNYTFGTDMAGVDLQISNTAGSITILQNPTYVYTTITLPESCKDYVVEFGLSDENNTVQSAAVFRCGNC